MTQPRPPATGPKLPAPKSAEVTEPFAALCRQAQALAGDVTFLAGLRRSSRHPGDLLRLALDAVPALELLPLAVLEGELRRGLPSPGAGQRGWSG